MYDQSYFAGIDIGSSAIKIVILDSEKQIAGYKVTPTGSHFNENTLEALRILQLETQISEKQLKYIVSTGYGRKLLRNANENISEITANAKGTSFFETGDACIKTIINIGGQDSKIIALDNNGMVKNFIMNDKCAAGTGRFLEMLSRNLNIDIDELGEIHTNFNGTPSTVNSTCAVFAESEIISLLSNGQSIAEIVSGVHHSIARRISRLAHRIAIQDVVFFDGGTALNKGMVKALETELMSNIYVPDYPQITTAIGAALMAKERYSLLKNE